jgi:hypothetical protein
MAACRGPEAAPETRPTPRPGSALEKAAEAFREQHDFATLQRVAGLLEPGVARAEVERLLGPVDGWDDPSVYYSSHQINGAGEPLGLTLDFYVWYTDGRPSQPSDRLERWTLGSGNRWESAKAGMGRARPAAPEAAPPALEATSDHYRRRRDYASLYALVARLPLGTPRNDVETLLGPPDRCEGVGSPCHYRSDRFNKAGLPVALIVDYRTPKPGGAGTITTDRVEAIGLGPVAPSAR